jgi:hypothetical protein
MNNTKKVKVLTVEINALVFESSPSGSCKYKGHSLADGTYLFITE